MRWDALFGDMEAQLAAGQHLQLEGEVAERARIDQAGVAFVDRLRGGLGRQVTAELTTGMIVRGVLGHAGSEWLVLNDRTHQWLIPHRAVVSIQGLGRFSLIEQSEARRKLGLASALRGLARDRQELTLHVTGAGEAALTRHGVIDRVGRDYFDLAVTLPGEARRPANIATVVTVPFHAVAALRALRHGS